MYAGKRKHEEGEEGDETLQPERSRSQSLGSEDELPRELGGEVYHEILKGKVDCDGGLWHVTDCARVRAP